jgi:hypothetical protein
LNNSDFSPNKIPPIHTVHIYITYSEAQVLGPAAVAGLLTGKQLPHSFFGLLFSGLGKAKCNAENCRRNSASIWDILDLL